MVDSILLSPCRFCERVRSPAGRDRGLANVEFEAGFFVTGVPAGEAESLSVMKLYVRGTILLLAGFVLAGCQTTEGPQKIGTRLDKKNVQRKMDFRSQETSWKSGLSEEFGHYADEDEPERPSWLKQNSIPTKARPEQHMISQVVARPLTRIAMIRQTAQKLAPAGVSLTSLSGMIGKRREARIDCMPATLRMLLNTVAWHYGRHIHVQSGYRSKHHNLVVGGARNSYHMSCKAVDIQVSGINKYKLAKYLKSLPGRGGVGTYCNTSTVHLDVGPKRQWHYGCGLKSKARRRQLAYQRSLLRNKSYK